MISEEWRAAPGWPEHEVSSLGRIRRARPGSNGRDFGVLSPQAFQRTGYLFARLYLPGKRHKNIALHWLVALAFLGPPPSPRHVAAHKDGSRTNNRADNLRWATPAENQADRIAHGTHMAGERHPGAKLTEADAASIRAAFMAGEKQRDIAARFGVHQATVHRICAGKSFATGYRAQREIAA